MKKEFLERRLDVKAFALSATSQSGHDALASHERLAQEVQGPAEGLTVHWTARGELRTAASGADEVWLHLEASTRLPLTCQRCMGPVEVDVASDRWFRFAMDEDAAAALDDESEEDVLVLSREFDLASLVEDELLMAVPLVPRHETCPVDVKLAVADPGFEVESSVKAKPFAALASLKLGKSS